MEKKWFSYVLVENIEGRFHHRITICKKVVATLSLTILFELSIIRVDMSKNCEIEAHNCDKVRIVRYKFLHFSRNSDFFLPANCEI